MSSRPAFFDESFDVVIIGGGMQGLLCGLEATKSGLRPIVLEANQLCGGASGASLRILHGGLRHLQTLSLDRAVRSAKAQDWFRRHYAGFVEPIDVVLPLDGGLRRPPLGQLASALQRTVSYFTGHGRETRPRVLGAGEARAFMAPFGFSGECSALNWQEYWIPEIEPLAQRIRSDIEVRGGVVVEGAQVRRIKEIEASRCIVEAHMAATGERHQIAPRHVIEATGPGYSGLSTRCRSAVPIVTGFNVVLELPLNASWAFGTPPSQRTGRSYFLIPYARQLLIGTGYVAGAEGDGSRPADTQVHSMVSDVASLVPGLGVTPDRISDVLWNDLPAKKAGVGYPSAKDSIVVSRTLPSRETYLRLYPSKLTTTPVVAASAIKKLSIKSNDSTS